MKPLLIFVFSLILISCGDDDNNNEPIDQLPPLTNTGENTFGCLIDGRAFTPRGGGLGGPSRGASYQYLSNSDWPNPIWVFQVFGDKNNTNEAVSINLGLLSFEDLTIGNYQLNIRENNGTGGGGIYIDVAGVYDTTEEYNGLITITHYDYDNRIISGTFEFEVEVNGEVVKITDGRFDMDF